MADYNEQVNRFWDEWTAETGQDSGDPDDFIEWAVTSGRLTLRPQAVRLALRRQVTQALRQAKRWDAEGGFTYRAKQCVMLFEGGVPHNHYFDIDTGGTATKRQKAVRQRREAVAHNVYRAACDAERMNKNFPDEPELNFFKDFTDDCAELRAAESTMLDEDDGEEAA
jgi:hypothetical protein